jgi:hypothetical protein
VSETSAGTRRPTTDYVVLALIAAAGLYLIGSLLQAFNEPIGLGEFTAGDDPLLRLRAAADTVNGIWVGIAAVAAAAFPLARPRRALQALAAIASVEALLTVYVFLYDASHRYGSRYFRIRRFSDGSFRLAALVVTVAVAMWAWDAARATSPATSPGPRSSE